MAAHFALASQVNSVFVIHFPEVWATQMQCHKTITGVVSSPALIPAPSTPLFLDESLLAQLFCPTCPQSHQLPVNIKLQKSLRSKARYSLPPGG